MFLGHDNVVMARVFYNFRNILNNAIVSFMRTILSERENPALRKVAREIPVVEITSEHIQTLIKEMKDLLAKEEYGVALAAPQLGEAIKLFIVSGRAIARDSRNAPDEPEKKEEQPALPDQVYINPVLVKVSRTKKNKHEGCLSIRGKWGEVPRAEKATLRAYDENGVQFTRGASGFLAHIFQHEMDHLEGILYTDKATKLYDEKEER
jgi:peptide deformylase